METIAQTEIWKNSYSVFGSFMGHFQDSDPFHSHTSLCKRATFKIEQFVNPDTLLHPDLLPHNMFFLKVEQKGLNS